MVTACYEKCGFRELLDTNFNLTATAYMSILSKKRVNSLKF